MKPMRYSLIIAIFFSFLNCGQRSSINDQKLSDNYSSLRTRMITISMSDQTLSQRQSETFSLLNSFIKAYPLSENTLILLASANNLSARQFDSLYNYLNPALRKNPYWARVDLTKSRIRVAETGKLFPEISLNDTLNASINTGSFKGKILFVDFWASWCVSCRQQFPHLKQIYAKYNSKGFEIMGVSMDEKRDAWIRALKQDSLSWPQYCDFMRFQENPLAKRFHITGIPANFLIDRNGILIGQDLSPKELETLISRL